MQRSTLLLVLLAALLGISETTQAQSLSGFEDFESARRPQLESPAEDVLDPMDPSSVIDDDDDQDQSRDEDSDDLETEDDDLSSERLPDEVISSNWPKHSMSEIDVSLAEVGRVPEDRSELLDGFGRLSPVGESVKVFAWEAPNIRYQPLYFEDVVLERYGQTQPAYRQGFRSAIIFGAQYFGLPLALLETKPKSCDHPLGYCRPGTCVPQTTQRHFFGAFSLR